MTELLSRHYYSINRLAPQWCLVAWLFAFAVRPKVGYNSLQIVGAEEGSRRWRAA
jgi:hypothetical protein